MSETILLAALAAAALLMILIRLPARLRLSLAKQPGLAGHFRIARRLARLVARYDYDAEEFFGSDNAPEAVASARRAGATID